MKILTAFFFALLLSIGAASADVSVAPPLTKGCANGVATDASGNPSGCVPSATIVLPKGCANGVATDANGVPSGCVPASTAGGCPWQVQTLAFISPTPYPITAADNCLTRVWDSAATATVVFGLTSSVPATFQNCLQTYKTGGSINITAASGVTIKGGATSLGSNSWACFQPTNVANVWSMTGGTLQALANPNASP